MNPKEQEFLKRLRATFRIEAEEHLQAISAGLIILEKTTDPEQRTAIVESIFRNAHSLKGAARSVNLKDIESICQPLESGFAALKRQEIPFSSALFDLFHQAVDSLTQLVAATEGEQTSADRALLRELIGRLSQSAQGVVPSNEPEPSQLAAETPLAEAEPESAEAPLFATSTEWAESPPAAETSLPKALRPPLKANPIMTRAIGETAPVETVRIPITKLDPLLLQAEEMIQAKLAAAQRAAELREIQQMLFLWKTESATWKDQRVAQSDEAPEGVSARLEALTSKVTSVSQAFEQDQRALRHMVDVHLDAMKQVLMMPVSMLVEVFPRLVRDLARNQGKQVELIVSGAEIEIDKRILEELKDPLIHLVRNCVDHGIEKTDVRIRSQKPQGGVITLAFSTKDSRQVEILVSDDGAGIDVKQVQATAIKAGIITAEAAEKLNPQEVLQIIFQSGITTSEMITDISGRGLGLAIVREKVEKLGGTVSVETRAEGGTTFRLRLPLTLATFRGVLVRAREQMFVLPTAQVERAMRVSQNDIQTVGNQETIRLDGQLLALVKLGDVLALPVRGEGVGRQHSPTYVATTDHIPVLILASAEKRLAVQVDEVLSEEEVLIKGLGKQLSRVRNIAGATILGVGTVVPVLNVADLMHSAVRPGGMVEAPMIAEKIAARTGRILVAEDSITARTLLKNILETSGHQVTTAVDGADALAQLGNGTFDLVVSDVDMPRMSGFELATKIRSDGRWSDLPVVLVTALESRQDRERGIEVGANAYIIKSSFDQSNLLEVIQRLL